MKLSPAIEKSGYGITGDIGGLPRQTYYTPDGRVIKAIPSLREYVKKGKNGEAVETGTRDANLDKGWLLTPPTELKLYCSGCDMWHDTQEEVDACIAKKKKWVDALGKRAIKQEADDVASLRQEVAELKEMLQKALEVKSG
jgi:hypothetical protein